MGSINVSNITGEWFQLPFPPYLGAKRVDLFMWAPNMNTCRFSKSLLNSLLYIEINYMKDKMRRT